MANPTMLFKKDGSTPMDIGDFKTALLDWQIVDLDDKKAVGNAIAAGWSLTPAGALETEPPDLEKDADPGPEFEEEPVKTSKRGK